VDYSPKYVCGVDYIRVAVYLISPLSYTNGRPDHVEKYYVTVQDGENPLDAFDREDTAPDTVSASIVGTLSDKQAAGHAFRPGEVWNLRDA
jgi:hypothetical protein